MAAIELHHLAKRYGAVTALDDLTAEIHPGRITAFLGANGSGKTTSMRILLGLSDPTSGQALIGGRRYARPAATRCTSSARSSTRASTRTAAARNHLRIVAAQATVSRTRVEEMLDARRSRRAGRSPGRRVLPRHAPAPRAGVGDDRRPVDPRAGRAVQRPRPGRHHHDARRSSGDFADRGGTVFLSSHLLAEVAHSADDVIIIDHGRLVTAGPIAELATGTIADQRHHRRRRPARDHPRQPGRRRPARPAPTASPSPASAARTSAGPPSTRASSSPSCAPSATISNRSSRTSSTTARHRRPRHDHRSSASSCSKMRTTPAAWVTAAVIAALTVAVRRRRRSCSPARTAPRRSAPPATSATPSPSGPRRASACSCSASRSPPARTATAPRSAPTSPNRGAAKCWSPSCSPARSSARSLGAGAFLFDLAVAVPLYAAKGVHHLPDQRRRARRRHRARHRLLRNARRRPRRTHPQHRRLDHRRPGLGRRRRTGRPATGVSVSR